jgi:hypothetical protein
MLGRLRMSIDEALRCYRTLAPKIFKKKWWTISGAKYIGAEARQYWFEGETLKQAVLDLLNERGVNKETKLFETDDPDCRV